MKFIVNKDYKNIRSYLQNFLLISKKNIHTLNMEKEGIRVNDKKCNLYTPLVLGDLLEINIELARSNYKENKDKKIMVEYEDNYILIASKPFGMKTHPNDNTKENDSLVNFLISEYKYLEPIHRLDIDTCGLVIFAKSPLIKAKLDIMLEKREIYRYYTAITSKYIQPQKITTFIGRNINEKNKMAVVKKGKEAITNILECHKISDNFYKSIISLETGRTHQIRVHLQHLGASIIGDKLYSNDYYKFNNMHLGALKVEFRHPVLEKYMIIESKLEMNIKNN